MNPPLKAPFPAFGGKRRVASLVWDRLGDVTNFIEPFANSAAVLLARPHVPRIETVNDLNSYISNFWRAVQRDSEAVAGHADFPVNEADLHARHRWLVLSSESAEFRERMKVDPEYFDAKIAGWWVWRACCWIGAGWCDDAIAPSQKMPLAPRPTGSGSGGNSFGVHAEKGPILAAKLPDISGHAGGSGRGVNQSSALTQKRPNISGFFNEHGERTHHGRGVHGKVPADPGETRNPSTWGQMPDIGGWNGDGQGGKGVHAKEPSEQMPTMEMCRTGGKGVNGVGPADSHRPQLADAYSRGRGVHGNDSAGTCEQRRAWLVAWFGQLADRLRTVRVCCGHWKRVCDSFSVTTRLGVTGVFLDAPYKTHLADGTANRSGDLYANDRSQDVNALVDEVIAYCAERGSDPLMRIAACSYAGEGYEVLLGLGWECVAWKADGGYANRSKGDKPENAERERIWFSPACKKSLKNAPPPMFGLFDDAEARS